MNIYESEKTANDNEGIIIGMDDERFASPEEAERAAEGFDDPEGLFIVFDGEHYRLAWS